MKTRKKSNSKLALLGVVSFGAISGATGSITVQGNTFHGETGVSVGNELNGVLSELTNIRELLNIENAGLLDLDTLGKAPRAEMYTAYGADSQPIENLGMKPSKRSVRFGFGSDNTVQGKPDADRQQTIFQQFVDMNTDAVILLGDNVAADATAVGGDNTWFGESITTLKTADFMDAHFSTLNLAQGVKYGQYKDHDDTSFDPALSGDQTLWCTDYEATAFQLGNTIKGDCYEDPEFRRPLDEQYEPGWDCARIAEAGKCKFNTNDCPVTCMLWYHFNPDASDSWKNDLKRLKETCDTNGYPADDYRYREGPLCMLENVQYSGWTSFDDFTALPGNYTSAVTYQLEWETTTYAASWGDPPKTCADFVADGDCGKWWAQIACPMTCQVAKCSNIVPDAPLNDLTCPSNKNIFSGDERTMDVYVADVEQIIANYKNAVNQYATLLSTDAFMELRNEGKFCQSLWDDHDFGQNNAGGIFLYAPYFRYLHTTVFRPPDVCTGSFINKNPADNTLLFDDNKSVTVNGVTLKGFPETYLRDELIKFKLGFETEMQTQGYSNKYGISFNSDSGAPNGKKYVIGMEMDFTMDGDTKVYNYAPLFFSGMEAYIAELENDSPVRKYGIFTSTLYCASENEDCVRVITMDDQSFRDDIEDIATDPVLQCEQHFGDDQLNWFFEELQKPASVRIVASGNPQYGISTLLQGVGDSYQSCTPERVKFINRLNELNVPGVFFIGGNQHATFVNAVEDLNTPTFEFVCSSMTNFGRPLFDPYPVQGNLVGFTEFNGNRLCSIDVDFESRVLIFKEYQFTDSSDMSVLTPGLLMRVPYDRVSYNPIYKPKDIITEDMLKYFHFSADLSQFTESEHILNSKTRYVKDIIFAEHETVVSKLSTTSGKTIAERAALFEEAGFVVKGTNETSNEIIITGSMFINKRGFQNTISALNAFRYNLYHNEEITTTLLLTMKDGDVTTSSITVPVTADLPYSIFTMSWLNRPPELEGSIGSYSNIHFEEDFESVAWDELVEVHAETEPSWGDNVVLNIEMQSNAVLGKTNGAGVEYYSFTINNLTWSSAVVEDKFNNPVPTITLENFTWYGRNNNMPCVEDENGQLSPHPENPYYIDDPKLSAADAGCMVDTTQIMTRGIKMTRTRFYTTFLQGVAFNNFDMNTSKNWRISMKVAHDWLLDSGDRPSFIWALYGEFDPDKYPKGGGVRQVGGLLQQWQPEPDEVALISVYSEPMIYGPTMTELPFVRYPVASVHREYANTLGIPYDVQKLSRNYNHGFDKGKYIYNTVTWEITFDEDPNLGLVRWFWDGHFITQATYGYKQVVAMKLEGRYAMLIDDIEFSYM